MKKLAIGLLAAAALTTTAHAQQKSDDVTVTLTGEVAGNIGIVAGAVSSVNLLDGPNSQDVAEFTISSNFIGSSATVTVDGDCTLTSGTNTASFDVRFEAGTNADNQQNSLISGNCGSSGTLPITGAFLDGEIFTLALVNLGTQQAAGNYTGELTVSVEVP